METSYTEITIEVLADWANIEHIRTEEKIKQLEKSGLKLIIRDGINIVYKTAQHH